MYPRVRIHMDRLRRNLDACAGIIQKVPGCTLMIVTKGVCAYPRGLFLPRLARPQHPASVGAAFMAARGRGQAPPLRDAPFFAGAAGQIAGGCGHPPLQAGAVRCVLVSRTLFSRRGRCPHRPAAPAGCRERAGTSPAPTSKRRKTARRKRNPGCRGGKNSFGNSGNFWAFFSSNR